MREETTTTNNNKKSKEECQNGWVILVCSSYKHSTFVQETCFLYLIRDFYFCFNFFFVTIYIIQAADATVMQILLSLSHITLATSEPMLGQIRKKSVCYSCMTTRLHVAPFYSMWFLFYSTECRRQSNRSGTSCKIVINS